MTAIARAEPPALLDRLLSLRDRLVSSARFREWAARFPLTRPIARRRARALFDLCAGFVDTQVLLSCVRLRLPEILLEGPQTEDQLARRMSLAPEATARLLAAAVSLKLVSRRGKDRDGIHRYGLGALGAALADNRAITAMIEHHTLLYADLNDPVALLRGESPDTRLARYWPYADGDHPAALGGDDVAPYSALMSASQPLVAAEVLGAYDFSRHRCLLDVGGGEGVFLSAVAARAPKLRLMLFDLPPVAARAAARFAAEGLVGRATAHGGDFVADALPEGADIVSLVRVALDHPDETVLALLRAVRRALPPDGTLLLAEPMSGTSGAEPIADAYFGFYLAAMGRGRPRSPEKFTELLDAAGFGRVRLHSTGTPLVTRVLTARPVQRPKV
jgi:demethylspheroidene O-methyltransferase